MAAKKTGSEETSRKKMANKKPAAKRTKTPESDASEAEDAGSKKGASPAVDLATSILSGESDRTITELGDDLASGKKSVAAAAARILDEIVDKDADAVVPIIDRYVAVISGSDKRPAQSAAKALPQMARIAPARVARHLAKLKAGYDAATPYGKDGLVRTFAGLCTASVAYQKRLEDVLNKALAGADHKTLIQWTEVVLPALKGEPHARARATVEGRLGGIPKVSAQRIADFLGIKLRLRYH
ncbi:MAG: hypothetical protein H6719_07855 [Sandaracinaceae bacterium]|nr:hypothetical protein [Sandaracinaceae bacterium]